VDEAQRLPWPGLTARLACAAVARADVVSGWDLAGRQPKPKPKPKPKPAERVAPAGSVYWLDDLDTTPEVLGKLAEQGLCFDAEHNAQRRGEGFNLHRRLPRYACWAIRQHGASSWRNGWWNGRQLAGSLGSATERY
jgi:hypothetical protein